MKSKLFPKKLQMPNVLVLLFSMIGIIIVLTWLIHVGEFERTLVVDLTVLVPDSFHFIDSSPQNPFQLILALPQAFIEVGSIVFFLFITGGSFKLIIETGILEA